MPLVGQKEKVKTLFHKASYALHGAGWGTPEDDVRYICTGTDKNGDYAIYVIEEKPGIKPVKITGVKKHFRVWMPYIYFFIKVPVSCILSRNSPAYILFSQKRAELNESALKIPLLPNLFGHGAICPNHQTPIRGTTPLITARKFITWFWNARGRIIFREYASPPKGFKNNVELYEEPPKKIFSRWEKMGREAHKIDWVKARQSSIIEAAHNLRFSYYLPWSETSNDNRCRPLEFNRKEIPHAAPGKRAIRATPKGRKSNPRKKTARSRRSRLG
jgi:hypothetical protein